MTSVSLHNKRSIQVTAADNDSSQLTMIHYHGMQNVKMLIKIFQGISFFRSHVYVKNKNTFWESLHFNTDHSFISIL